MSTNPANLHVILDLPPSMNHYYFTAKNGQRIMTPKAKWWMTNAKWQLKIIAKTERWRMVEGRKVIAKIWVYWPDNRKRDTHNLHKALLDAAEGIIYDNDRWALARDMDFSVDRERPRVEMEFEEATA